MGNLNITTNNQERFFLYKYEVPTKILEENFSHLPEDDCLDGWIKYRNVYYHTSDFVVATDHSGIDSEFWHGILNETAFSGILLRVVDSDTYKIATFTS